MTLHRRKLWKKRFKRPLRSFSGTPTPSLSPGFRTPRSFFNRPEKFCTLPTKSSATLSTVPIVELACARFLFPRLTSENDATHHVSVFLFSAEDGKTRLQKKRDIRDANKIGTKEKRRSCGDEEERVPSSHSLPTLPTLPPKMTFRLLLFPKEAVRRAPRRPRCHGNRSLEFAVSPILPGVASMRS